MKLFLNYLRNTLLVAIALIIALNMGALISGPISAKQSDDPYKNLKVLVDAISIVQKNYVEDVEKKELIYGAINGMLSSLDPHSSFMPPESFKEMQVETKGKFGGVGIEITMKEGVLTVVSPIEDTPAFRAGISAGDIIIKIDNVPTKGMTILDAVKRMRGKKNTKVVLTIYREGEPEPIDFPIVRAIIKIKSVKSEVLDDSYGYVKVTQFQERTTGDLKKALNQIEKKTEKIKGLILDLRNNPGGLLDQAVKVSDLFLSAGLIVYTDGRMEAQKMKFYATEAGTEPKYPIVVIVNAGSASASEIVAGALQDTGRGLILGTKTFGKGSVQTILPMEDGSGIRITTARYYTPNGRSIQAEGITPDLIIDKMESPVEKKHLVIREKDLKNHMKNGNDKENGDNNKENESKKQSDNQIKSALDILKSWEIFMKGMQRTS
ncbi:MAG: S41 family peptidase [Deltaproteobacteria bacterium]|nr:S41 family peptidase [Deltaproteobacteria bacterium]